MRSFLPSLLLTSLLCWTACSGGGGGGATDLGATGDAPNPPDTLIFGSLDSAPSEVNTPTSDTANQDSSVTPSPDTTEQDTTENDAGQPPAHPPISGGVIVLELKNNNPSVHLASVAAHFQYGPPTEAPTHTVEGPCATICSDGSANPPPAGMGLDAGDISFNGLLQPLTLTSTTNEENGTVYLSPLPDDLASILPTVGDISVETTGGSDVPAWQASAAVPAPLSIFKPGGGELNKNSPLEMTWNAANGTHTRIDIFILGSSSGEQLPGYTIRCNLAGDPGSFIISPALLAQLPGEGPSGVFGASDFLVYGISRITLSEVSLPQNKGTVSLAVTRTEGGYAPLAL